MKFIEFLENHCDEYADVRLFIESRYEDGARRIKIDEADWDKFHKRRIYDFVIGRSFVEVTIRI